MRDDLCVWDPHSGQYLDLVSSHDGTWTFYFGRTSDRQSVRGLSYDDGSRMLRQTLLASRLIAEVVWEDDIKLPRTFE